MEGEDGEEMQVVGRLLKIWIWSLLTAGGEVPATDDVLWEEGPSNQEQHRHSRTSSARCRGAELQAAPQLCSPQLHSSEPSLGVITGGVQDSHVVLD